MADSDGIRRTISQVAESALKPDGLGQISQYIAGEDANRLRDLSQNYSKTIVMVTHEPTVAAYAQEVAVLRDGKLIERFATEGPGNGQGLAARYQECLR